MSNKLKGEIELNRHMLQEQCDPYRLLISVIHVFTDCVDINELSST